MICISTLIENVSELVEADVLVPVNVRLLHHLPQLVISEHQAYPGAIRGQYWPLAGYLETWSVHI